MTQRDRDIATAVDVARTVRHPEWVAPQRLAEYKVEARPEIRGYGAGARVLAPFPQSRARPRLP